MSCLVKICGITRLEDAESAVAEGAGAIGFIMWPGSPRFIEPDRAGAIASRLPKAVWRVGVFVDQAAETVNDYANRAGLTHVQLHGNETIELARLIEKPVIKATSLIGNAADAGWPKDTLWLVDAHDPQRHGGTGRKADWDAAARFASSHRVLLAGGVTAENVREALGRVRPFGIDVSSGVEASPGIKDRNKLARLFEAVRQVEREKAGIA